MAVTWTVDNLKTRKQLGSLSDVVEVVYWRATEIETVDGVEHSGTLYGSVSLDAPESSSFTAYTSITKDNAVAWAKAKLGEHKVTEIETNVGIQVTKSKTPSVTMGVPWS
tara:strand:+ start:4025 stop:4354 length:330 start_codon:yes stop_codon:yes gene_type:complete